jgi:hypothetical protein
MARRSRTTRRANLKSSRPPVLAAWLFEHLTQREHREALAGDLLEEYIRHRSDMWYWRQVLVAVVADFSTELRARWVSFVFALVVCGTVPWNQLFHSARFRSFLSSGINLSWPASFLAGIAIMSAFQGAILLVALGIYVLGTKSFHPRSFLTALCPALLVLTLGNTAVTISQVLPLPRLLFYYALWRLPLFFGLVISMRWVAPANAARTHTPGLTT